MDPVDILYKYANSQQLTMRLTKIDSQNLDLH